METNGQVALRTLNLKKVIIPVVSGIAITAFLFYKSGKISNDLLHTIAHPNWGYACAAIFSIVLRELGHIFRLRIVSNATLSWVSCFYVAILWEFASSVTPSVVGGGVVAVFLFSKEGLSLGRSLSYVMINGLLDNLFFLIAALPSFFGYYKNIFAMAGELSSTVRFIFFTNYSILLVYTLTIFTGIFINPYILKWILTRVTGIRILSRWRTQAYQMGQDIISTSKEFRGRKLKFWLNMLLCTTFTWIARYSFLSLLIASYINTPLKTHVATFSKQIVIWALMLVPIAPGGSGIAEISFEEFFKEALGEYILPILLLWRTCTFYLYLTMGGCTLPKWIKRVLKSK